MDSQTVDFSAYLGRIWQDKFKILGFGVVAVVLALAYTFLIKPKYRATTILLLPPAAAPSAASGLVAALGVSSGSASPVLILQGVAMSRTAVLPAAQQEKLPLVDFMKMLSVTPNIEQNQLAIAVTSGNKQQALRATERVLAELTALNTKTSFSLAARKASTLQTAVAEKTKELDEAYKKLLEFQSKTTTAPNPVADATGSAMLARLREIEYDLGRVQQQITVAKASAAAQGKVAATLPTGIPESEKWRNRLVDLEAQIRVLLQSRGPNAPEVVKLTRELEETKKIATEQIARYMTSIQENVESGLATLVAQEQVLIWQRDYAKKLAAMAPTETATLQRLLAEIATRQEVLRTVRISYEQATIEAGVEPVNWSVLVPPYADDKPINKNMIMNSIFGLVLGIFIGTAVSVIQRRPRTQKTPA